MTLRSGSAAARPAAIATAALVGFSVPALSAAAQGGPVATLRLGQMRTFRAAAIPAGATIACVGNGKRVVLTVPEHAAVPRTGSSMKITWVRGLHLTLTSNGHGTFVAACI